MCVNVKKQKKYYFESRYVIAFNTTGKIKKILENRKKIKLIDSKKTIVKLA